MNKTILGTAVLLGLLGIGLGAFGAHALQGLPDATDLRVFETGVRYQMYHVLFLLFLGTTTTLGPSQKKWIFYLITLGVICFSFSLYLIATKEITGLETGIIGPVTPFGGLLLLTGWALLGYRVFRQFD